MISVQLDIEMFSIERGSVVLDMLELFLFLEMIPKFSQSELHVKSKFQNINQNNVEN